MDKTDLCFTPATELAGAIRAKKLSSVEITSTVLDRIKALEPEAERLRASRRGRGDGRRGKSRRRVGQGSIASDRCTAFP